MELDEFINSSDIEGNDIMEIDTPIAVVTESDIFQKEIWQFRVFPYYENLKKDADVYFSHIKTGLAHSILLRDARPGFIYWVYELDRFIQLYSRRFTKVDHINLVKLLHSVLTMEKLDFRVVKIVANTLTTLLISKKLLKRSDIQLDWLPLYNLYMEVHKNMEEDSVLLPENLKKVLCTAIAECNVFFSDLATQEILNEVRPMICPWDDSSILAFSIMRIFLPTGYTADEHNKFGATLWFDEFWHWYKTNDNPTLVISEKIISVFSSLSKDCPGYVDWTDKYDLLFSRVLRSFKLAVGADRVTFSSNNRNFSAMTQLIIYCMSGADNNVQPHLDQLFATLESYFYPSNSGTHSSNLLTFMLQLCTHLLSRVSRERYRADYYIIKVPPKMCLSDKQIDAFVKSLLPCLKYAAFSKVQHELVPSIMRILAFLSPGIIIPAVLNLVYPALETVTEPHRLTQSLHILACICVPLVRDDPTRSDGERHPMSGIEEVNPGAYLKSYRCHALSILINILPGIDVNDISKSILTFQIIGILLILIPVVDCSEAVLVCSDLTEEEKELCSATACFDSFVDQLLNRIFNIIEMLGHSVQISHNGEHQNLAKGKGKSMEEFIIEKGVLTVFKALIRNCNSATYKAITEKFCDFMKETVFDSKPAMDTLTRITAILVGNNPSYAFPIFFKFSSEKLLKLLADEACLCEEEEADVAVIWYLTLFSEIMRGSLGLVILKHRKEIENLLSSILRFQNKDAFHLVGIVAQNILYSLCSIYPITRNYYEQFDLPFNQYLPIRHWADTIDKKSWTMKWHVPSDEEVLFANDLVQILVFDSLKVLSKPESLKNIELLKWLTILRFALEGCSNLCPYFEGEVLSVMPTVTPNIHFETTVLPSTVKLLQTADGKNLRNAVFEEIRKLADYLLLKRENDTKSTLQLINVIRILMHVKAVDGSSFQMQHSTFQMTKRILSDPVRGNVFIIESIMEGMVSFLHARRQLSKPLVGLTPTHLVALKLLVRLGTSSYSGVRIEAQKVLDVSFAWWTYSYKLVLDDILKILNNYESYSHEQFKGALYMLLNGKELSICVRQDWAALNKIWPSMVRAHHSEKPSIILLFETAQDIIVGNFSSFQISFCFPDSIIPVAKKLLESYEGCFHFPVWPALTDLQLEEAKLLEIQRNKTNTALYYQLCTELLKLSTDNTLHWRHVDMSQSFLSLLFRRDVAFSDDVVLLFFKLLASDSIKTRRTAMALTSSWLKINKPKAVKQLYPFENKIDPNNGPNAVWPIKYGFRKDNEMMLYKSQNQPNTAEQWNSTRFFFKMHFGYYTWPKEFKCYATPSEQVNVNRTKFTNLENSIIAILTDEAFFEKTTYFLSLEEKKGSDEFNAITYAFFYRIFRNFNDALFPAISKHFSKLLEDKREGSQRLAAEIFAGLICGSKLWTFEKLQPIQEWLLPRFNNALENIDTESMRNWGTCIATICGLCEPRQVGWILQALFALVQKPCDNIFHSTSRLYILHCALIQFEWRIPELWRELYNYCAPLVGHTYHNMRYRVANCIASTNVTYLPDTYVNPELVSKLNLVSFQEVLQSVAFDLDVLKSIVLNKSFVDNMPKAMDCSIQNTAANNQLSLSYNATALANKTVSSTPNLSNGTIVTNKKEKLVFLTLIDIIYSLAIQPLNCLSNINAVYSLIPVLAHYSYETNDEELRDSCQSLLIQNLGTTPILLEDIPAFLDVCFLTVHHCVWWKTKLGLLRFLQVFVFNNLFQLKAFRLQVQQLLLQLIADPQLEVRACAAQTLSGLIHCAYLPVDESLLGFAKTELLCVTDSLRLHAGILTLSAIIQAYPYSVPLFLPETLMMLAQNAHSHCQPIYMTVKQTLSEFKRTHQDCWHEHKQEFTDEQLAMLTDLLVSPNYYV